MCSEGGMAASGANAVPAGVGVCGSRNLTGKLKLAQHGPLSHNHEDGKGMDFYDMERIGQ